MKGYILVLAVGIALSGCKKDRRTEFFTIHDHVDFTIQPGLNTFDTHIYVIGPIGSTLDDRLMAAGRTRDEVVAIEAKSAYLSSIFEDVDLDFIHQVSVHILDSFNPSDKIEFFYLDPVPFRDKVGIQLFPGIADISEWMDRDYYGIEVRLNFRQNSPTLIQMRLEYEIRVLGE
jgi:hypothetical protein